MPIIIHDRLFIIECLWKCHYSIWDVKATTAKLTNTQDCLWVTNYYYCPGWCGSVDWLRSCEPRGRWLHSQPGHMPGLWARSPAGGVWEASTHWCFSPSLSLSLPLCLKINKWNLQTVVLLRNLREKRAFSR